MTRRLAVTLEQCWHRVPGGTATSALGATRALAARGDTEVIGVSAWHRRPPAPAFRPSVEVRSLRRSRLWLYESWHRYRRPPVEAATGAVDAIWVSGVAMPPRSAPLLVTVHDLAVLDHPEHHTARGRSFLRRAVELARDEADLVLCPSLTTLERCRAAGFDAARLRHVPWGVDQSMVAEADAQEVCRRFGLDNRFVLWTGTVEPRKNLRRLIEAFASLDAPDVDLVLVGPDGWNEDVSEAVSALGRRVHRLGFVASDDLAALYAAATVFAYPSVLEGFGLPVLEAMAQATPVVTSAGTATEEIVEGIGSAVDPTSVSAIADALDAVLADPAAAARRGQEARRRAEGYSWERTAELISAAASEVTS